MSMITGEAIPAFRMSMLLMGLKAELTGMRLTGKVNCYATIKREFNLKGSKTSVYDQFAKIVEINNAKLGVSNGN